MQCSAHITNHYKVCVTGHMVVVNKRAKFIKVIYSLISIQYQNTLSLQNELRF